jgi:hypothetical protein
MTDLDAIRARDAEDFGRIHDRDGTVRYEAIENANLDRRTLLAEVDRLTYSVAPFTTWRGTCGHLWDRAVEDTDECPRCAMNARLPQAIADGIQMAYRNSAMDERARILAALEGLFVFSGNSLDRDEVIAAIKGEAS